MFPQFAPTTIKPHGAKNEAKSSVLHVSFIFLLHADAICHNSPHHCVGFFISASRCLFLPSLPLSHNTTQLTQLISHNSCDTIHPTQLLFAWQVQHLESLGAACGQRPPRDRAPFCEMSCGSEVVWDELYEMSGVRWVVWDEWCEMSCGRRRRRRRRTRSRESAIKNKNPTQRCGEKHSSSHKNISWNPLQILRNTTWQLPCTCHMSSHVSFPSPSPLLPRHRPSLLEDPLGSARWSARWGARQGAQDPPGSTVPPWSPASGRAVAYCCGENEKQCATSAFLWGGASISYWTFTIRCVYIYTYIYYIYII